FQAEDGIRDFHVTGVQTCALPIYYDSRLPSGKNNYTYPSVSASFVFSEVTELPWLSFGKIRASYAKVGNELNWYQTAQTYGLGRSEERRVGKECRAGVGSGQ